MADGQIQIGTYKCEEENRMLEIGQYKSKNTNMSIQTRQNINLKIKIRQINLY